MKFKLLFATSILALSAGSAQAQFVDGLSLGLNFSGGAGSEAPDPDVDTVDAGEITGVVPQGNWNNAQGASGNLAALVDSGGSATATTVTYSSSNTWGRNLTATPTNDLLSDYLDGGTGVPVNITFSNVPYAIYDVYVYTRRNENGFVGGDGMSDYTVNGAVQTVVTGDIQNSFLLATPTSLGNYVKFDDVTGATLTVQANLNAGNFRAPVDGVQIVEQIPEPNSFALIAGLAGAAMLSRRRRARA